MNRLERFGVPFVPSQIAQSEGGSIVALPSAPRLNAEGGGSQAKTVPAGVFAAFAPDLAINIPSAPDLPARRPLCPHGLRRDVIAVTEWSVSFALRSSRSRAATPFVTRAIGPVCVK